MLAIALMFFATASAAQAQPERPLTEAERNCRDDRGVDRCAAEQHRKVLALYDMQPIETHARAGDQVRRVFYVDGYGRDMVAIAFTRPAGGDAMLSVHWPRKAGEPARAPATALISGEIWRNVLRRSADFDRDLQPEPKDAKSDAITICLHSWVYTVEASDRPAQKGGEEQVARKVHDACGEGLAERFAHDAQEMALALVPFCDALDSEQHRNPAAQLHACQALEGDRLAAAAALNRITVLNHIGSGDVDKAKQAFRYDAALDWGGEAAAGAPGGAADLWLRKAAVGGRASFYVGRVVGERADRARADGELVRYVESGAEPKQQVAPVSLILEARDGFPLMVSRATVGPWRDRGR
jgi:hypothetical protein